MSYGVKTGIPIEYRNCNQIKTVLFVLFEHVDINGKGDIYLLIAECKSYDDN